MINYKTYILFFIKSRYNVHLTFSHIHYYYHWLSLLSCTYPTDVLCKQTPKSADTSHLNNAKGNHRTFQWNMRTTQISFMLSHLANYSSSLFWNIPVSFIGTGIYPHKKEIVKICNYVAIGEKLFALNFRKSQILKMHPHRVDLEIKVQLII